MGRGRSTGLKKALSSGVLTCRGNVLGWVLDPLEFAAFQTMVPRVVLLSQSGKSAWHPKGRVSL